MRPLALAMLLPGLLLLPGASVPLHAQTDEEGAAFAGLSGPEIARVVRFELYLAGAGAAAAFQDGSVSDVQVQAHLDRAAAGVEILAARHGFPDSTRVQGSGRWATTRDRLEGWRTLTAEKYVGPSEGCDESDRILSCEGWKDFPTLAGIYYSIGWFEERLRQAGLARGPVTHGTSGDLDACLGESHALHRRRADARSFRDVAPAVGVNMTVPRYCWLAVPPRAAQDGWDAYRTRRLAEVGG